MKRRLKSVLTILSLFIIPACINTYIDNSDDSGSDDDNDPDVTINYNFYGSSADAMAKNCENHESNGDYTWESSSEVTIDLDGKSATINGSGATASDSVVTISSAGNYRISGTLSDGQIVVNTEDSGNVRLILNNAEIGCSSGVPVYIKKSAKTILILSDNSSNKITDESSAADTTSGTPNAAIYSLYNLSLSGNGSLTVSSKNNSGIASAKGFIIASGTINVTSGKAALHGKDYLVVESGNITLNAGGDGLKSDNEEDETKGYVAILSGTLDITSKGDAIVARTDAIISSGKITIVSGSEGDTSTSSKGIKGLENVIIDNGTIDLTCTDNAIHSKGNITINGGSLSIATSQTGANGIDSDSIISVTGGTFDITINGDQSKAIKSSGTITLNGGDMTIKTSGNVILETSGSGNEPSYCTAMKADGNITIGGSNITITSSGKGGKGISSDANFTMASGYLSITTTGAGATYTNSSGTTDSYNATCISTNGTTTILGGTVILSSSGSAGKGITSNGALTFGDDSNSPKVTITTTGSKITVSGGSSSGGNFGGPGGGGSSSSANYSSAKAVKSDAAITINNGTITISSSDDGIKSEKSITVNNGSISVTKSTEAMESPSITINDGYVSLVASDDGFNATAGLTAGGTENDDGSILTINGGTVAVSTTTGDGIDSNGSLNITGGTIIVQGPNSSPELGMDVNGSSIVSGGLLMISGPNSGNMIEAPSSSSTQYCVKVTSSSIGTNMFRVEDASGNEIFTFKPVRSAYYIVFSSPALKSGSSYSIYTGGSSTGISTNGYYTSGTYSGGTLKKSFSISSKISYVSF
ncbi:MAG TPA: carbohydrate-binding domain-containing protein [Prolixibacteraceae bacterium]|nr:carbohydrate-binding domain-containing protein [Prolixibacteraceae bacterium]